MSLALFSANCFADRRTPDDRSVLLSSADYDVYLSTLHKCVGVNKVQALWKGLNYQVAKNSAVSTLKVLTIDTNEIFDLIENKGLSPEFKKIINSMGFYYALNDCYGTNDVSKQAYFAGLLLSDAAGKIGSLKLAVVALAGVRGLAVVGRISPFALKFFQAAGATAAIYFAYHLIQKEFKPRTQEEKLKIEEVQSRAVEDPLYYVESAKTIIQERITEIENSLKAEGLAPEERRALETKLETLQTSISTITALQKKV